MEYKILTADDPCGLEECVSEAIAKGFVPFGNIAIQSLRWEDEGKGEVETSILWTQAVIKRNHGNQRAHDDPCRNGHISITHGHCDACGENVAGPDDSPDRTHIDALDRIKDDVHRAWRAARQNTPYHSEQAGIRALELLEQLLEVLLDDAIAAA